MSMLDLITVSDYAKQHGILPAQAADILSKLGMIGIKRAAWSSQLVKLGAYSHQTNDCVKLRGASGFDSMAQIAEAIGLKVSRSESKAGTLVIVERKA